ncbi:MAG: cell envelope integrity protein TolA [Betaproteobacteria bacterium]|nr:cell envelope integrity protein TolA [Betaproteobacteria bacterium]
MALDRPRRPARMSGQWPALALAIAVHVAFISVLVFSLRWQNRKPEPVTVELYAPPQKVALAEPVAKPAPVPPPEPTPAPEPVPVPPVEAPPKTAAPKPEPKVETPDPRAAEIALKARKDEEDRKKREQAAREKQQREQAAREKQEREKREADQLEAERKKRDEQRRLAEARERQTREAEALREQAELEQAARARQQKADAAAAARTRAEADYVRRIQSKVKGNVVLPPDVAGNPEAIFDVIQLPTGEIIDAVLRKSSGSRAYDDAVQRAIVKSSPLPRPDRPDLFQRTLTLKFRPQD